MFLQIGEKMRTVVVFLLFVIGSSSVVDAADAADSADAAPLRRLLTGDDSRGWEAVGRLDIAGRGMCTGALIAPDLVLTAAHCLHDRDTNTRVPPSEIEFQAGLRHDRAEAYRLVRNAVPHPDFVFEPDGRPQVTNDLALLQLERPIENGSVIPFKTAQAPRTGDVVGVVSYAHDRSDTPALQESCHVLAHRPGSVVLSCDVDFGSSGAPVFAIEDGVARIVSVVSAKAEASGWRVALGTSIAGPLQVLMQELDALPGGGSSGPRRIRRIGQTAGRQQSGAKFLRP